MNKFKNILIVAGGTGGHVFPAYSLANFFKTEKKKVHLVTDERGYRYLKDYNINDLIIINSETIFHKNPFKILYSILLIIKAFIISSFTLFKKKPDLVIGMGGYLSFPVCISAFILRRPIVLYENNSLIGKTNKLLSFISKRILTSFPEVKGISQKNKIKVSYIGNIIRGEFLTYDHTLPNNSNSKLNILVLGGSQAAKVFAEKLPSIFYELKKISDIKISQQCLIEQESFLTTFYTEKKIDFELFNFSSNVINYFKQCDLVITRSGSSALAELINCNIPFIAIPLPSSTDNHQLENAKYFEKNGVNFLIEQNEIDTKLFSLIKLILEDKSLLSHMMKKQKGYSDKNVYKNFIKEIESITL